ncbi:hypothetical protein SAMN06297358_3296 [Pedobacter xixiisoli]|uniref:Uncharacterized protein n=1 Tax=Pedobacter xixiisoli TaxID=1476464 RepID=A0A286AAU6_9SPHI|nr:hypothetical protein SAMN06297358_3296 [Pedobacter xixiisoli]
MGDGYVKITHGNTATLENTLLLYICRRPAGTELATGSAAVK